MYQVEFHDSGPFIRTGRPQFRQLSMISALMGVPAPPPCGLWPGTITDPSGRDWFVSRDLLVEGVIAWSSIGTLGSAVGVR